MATIDPSLFERVQVTDSLAEAIDRPPLTFWGEVWQRLRKNRLAMVGLVILIILVFMAAVGPYMTPYDYRQQDYENMDSPPSSQYWFGTDHLGRDIFARTWTGARISLYIAVMATLIDLLIGIIYGSVSGYFGGKVDEVMMRIVDILYGVPYLLMVILFSIVFEPGLTSLILAMAATGWLTMARLIRGQVLQLKEQEFVLAAKTLGASPLRIMFRHLIPNTMGVILVELTLTIPDRIFAEAFLSFISLGVPPPMASWGIMVKEAYEVFKVYPYQLLFPGMGICLTMLAFNVLGDGLRDALDPRLRQ